MLWYDSVNDITSGSKLEPLPLEYKRVVQDGDIGNTRIAPTYRQSKHTKSPSESDDPKMFKNLLKSVKHHFPQEFFVS